MQSLDDNSHMPLRVSEYIILELFLINIMVPTLALPFNSVGFYIYSKDISF